MIHPTYSPGRVEGEKERVCILGQLDADEFVKLVMAKSKSPEEEMQEAWTYFDVDCNGEWRMSAVVSYGVLMNSRFARLCLTLL